MITLIAIQVALLVRWPVWATPTGTWLALILEISIIVMFIALAWRGVLFNQKLLAGRLRVQYWMGCIGCAGLTFFIHAWGIGNLLGI